MAEIKVFQMNDSDWYAAETAEEATREMALTLGYDATPESIAEMCKDCEVEPLALDEAALDRLRFREEDDETGETLWRSFRERLAKMTAEGAPFPIFFASTEY